MSSLLSHIRFQAYHKAIFAAVALAALLYSASSCGGSAPQEPDNACPRLESMKGDAAKGLVIARESDAPPMFACEDYNALSGCEGFEKELGDMLAEKLGIAKVSYVFGEYEELPDLVVKGEADILLSGFVPDNSLDGVAWSKSYLEFGLCLIVKKGSSITNTAALAGSNKKVLVYEGDEAALDWAMRNLPGVEVVQAADPVGEGGVWMKAVEEGTVDAAVYDYPFAIAELKESYPNLQIVELNLNSSSYGIAVAADATCLLSEIDAAIGDILASMRYANVVQKHLKSDAIEVADVEKSPDAKVHTVKAGESLSMIALEYFGDVERWRDVYELNKSILPNPHLIFEGDVILLPES